MTQHIFRPDLKASHIESLKDYWTDDIYKQYFPNMVSSSLHDTDLAFQSKGIDRVLFLEGGKEVRIDDKYRKEYYGDILLEESSSVEHNTKGWIEKSLVIDYIAYAIPSKGICYMLPFQEVQAAWKRNKEQWKKQYPKILAENETYYTLSWAIPPNVLYFEIARSQLICFPPETY